MKTKINNVNILTMDSQYHEYFHSHLIIEDDKIIAINDDDMKVDKVIDGKNGILIPGMVNVHSHLSMIPFRSLGDDCPDRLRRFLFPLEAKAMNKDLVYSSAKYAACELMLGGVTQVFDMYYYEDEVAKALSEMNMRATVAETILDFAHTNSKKPYEGLEYSEWFIKKWKNKNNLITPAIAPHATNTNSAKALKKALEIANKYDVLLSMHVSEMDYEMDYFRKEYNMTPVEYLNSIGLLNERLLAAHCIHLSQNDITLLKEKNVKIAHCIGSNTKAGKGIMPLKDINEQEIVVGLGSDGPSSGNTLDIITQLPLIPKFHKTREHNRAIFSAKEVLTFATIGGAKCLRTDKETGSIEIGKKADLVLIETQSVNMFPIYDYYSAVVYSANPSNVESVWINGKQVVNNKTLVDVSLEKIRDDLNHQMKTFKDLAIELSKDIKN